MQTWAKHHIRVCQAWRNGARIKACKGGTDRTISKMDTFANKGKSEKRGRLIQAEPTWKEVRWGCSRYKSATEMKADSTHAVSTRLVYICEQPTCCVKCMCIRLINGFMAMQEDRFSVSFLPSCFVCVCDRKQMCSIWNAFSGLHLFYRVALIAECSLLPQYNLLSVKGKLLQFHHFIFPLPILVSQ